MQLQLGTPLACCLQSHSSCLGHHRPGSCRGCGRIQICMHARHEPVHARKAMSPCTHARHEPMHARKAMGLCMQAASTVQLGVHSTLPSRTAAHPSSLSIASYATHTVRSRLSLRHDSTDLRVVVVDHKVVVQVTPLHLHGRLARAHCGQERLPVPAMIAKRTQSERNRKESSPPPA